MSVRYATGFSVGALIWLSSLLTPESLRYDLWALALLVEMGTPVLGYSTVRSVPGHVSHMPERFGLFTLIVLGKSIVVLTSGVVETSWRPVSALTAVSGFTVAACIWWLYFDHVDEEAIGQSFTSGVAGVVRSHVWGYGNLAVWAGRHRQRGDRVRHLGGVGARVDHGDPLVCVRRHLPLPACHQRHSARHALVTTWRRRCPTPRRRHRRGRARASRRLPAPADARRAFGAAPGRVDGLRDLAHQPPSG